MFWALKAFFCSNIKSVLQSNSQLQAVKARDAIHGFVCIQMAIKITSIGHNLRFRWPTKLKKHHLSQNRTAILIMYKYIPNYKG